MEVPLGLQQANTHDHSPHNFSTSIDYSAPPGSPFAFPLPQQSPMIEPAHSPLGAHSSLTWSALDQAHTNPEILCPRTPASRATSPNSNSGSFRQGVQGSATPTALVTASTFSPIQVRSATRVGLAHVTVQDPGRITDAIGVSPHPAPRSQVPPQATPRIVLPGPQAATSSPSLQPICTVDPFLAAPHADATGSPLIPSTPVGCSHLPLAPHTSQASIPRSIPRSRQFQLPSTPRALPSTPLFRSVSTPGRPLAHSTPSANRAPPLNLSNVLSVSLPGSRAGTPSPSFRAPNTPAPVSRRAFPLTASGSASSSVNTPLRTLHTSSAPSPPSDTFYDRSNASQPAGCPSTPGLGHGFASNTLDEPTSGGQSPVTQSPRLHRVRTPPPMAQPYNRVVVSDQAVEESEGFIRRETDLEYVPLRVELIAPITPQAPTTTELAIAKAREIRHIQQGRKSNHKPNATPFTSGDRMGVFSKPHQGYMKVMKAHFLWDYVTRSPWSEDGEDLIRRAKAFANTATGLAGDTICTDIFKATVSNY